MSGWLLLMIAICFVLPYKIKGFVIVKHSGNSSDTLCSLFSPCTELQPALPEMKSGSTLVISAGTNYTLSYDDAMTMYGMESISIVGNGSANTVITCDSDAGLAFINVHNITIANLTLVGCGAWRNSTTQNGTFNHTLVFQCGIYFLDCSDVTIYDLMLRDGPGTGVMMYDIIGMVTIINSHFLHNRVPPANVDKTPGGGGLYIEFSFCKPNTTDFEACKPSEQADANYFIDNCTFIDNIGTSIKENTTKFIFPIGHVHQQFGRGGAISIHFKGNATNNTIVIIDCLMLNNGAVWGGGILVDLLDFARDNHVFVKDVHFILNYIPIKTGTGGGAFRVHYYPQIDSPGNILNLTNCTFDSNSAYYGGGISLSTNRETNVFTATNGITIRSCTWRNNTAHIGSAVDLSSYYDVPDGKLVTPVIINCSFFQHSNNVFTPETIQLVGLGAVHSDGIAFAFEGDNYFVENSGTALAATNAIIDFRQNASAIFLCNHGLRGGAMALLGDTWLRIYPHARLWFEGNSATEKGGAIYSISVGLRDVNSRKCFIRYYDYKLPPTEWKANLTFINNTSPNPGHAIYCTTLITCSWDNSSIVTTPKVLRRTFRWKNVFTYDKFDNDTIATDLRYVDVNQSTLRLAPGVLHNLSFVAEDDIGAHRKAVFFVHSTNNLVTVADASTYMSDKSVKVLGSPGQTCQLDFQTISTRTLTFSLNTTLIKCPPGFYLPKTSDPSKSLCRCSIYDKNERYDEIPYCNEATLQAYLQPHFWAGYIRNNSVLVTGRCPARYCFTNGTKKLALPTEASNVELNHLICSPTNREGILCGQCKQGYHIYANSKVHKCGQCTILHGKVIILFSKFVPLVIFLITVMLLDINLASGPLNTFVFFSQMLPTLDLQASGQITMVSAARPFVEIYRFCYGVFNLEYFESLDSFPDVCTIRYRSALTSAALDYIVAFLPIIVIFLAWLVMYISGCCVFMGQRNCLGRMGDCLCQVYHRLKPNISLSESFFRGLVTFLILSYAKLTVVTLSILTPVYLTGRGNRDYDVMTSLDGTQEYFGQGHLLYAIPAIVVLIIFILLPLATIFMYPCVCNCLGLHVHRIMPFFDALQVAFKHNCLYFAPLYFVYRLILVTIYTFTPEVQQRYVLQQVFCIGILILHVMAQPYKNALHNKADIFLLALMPAVISISFFQLFRVTNSNNINQLALAIQIVLLYLPLIYITMVILHKLYQCRKVNRENGRALTTGYQSFENVPPRVLDSYSEAENDEPDKVFQTYTDERQADYKF